MGSTYCLVVRGSVPSAFARMVQDQFDDARVDTGPHHTVIECSVRDQSALRALLTQLWDVGGEVLLAAQLVTTSPRSHHDHTD